MELEINSKGPSSEQINLRTHHYAAENRFRPGALEGGEAELIIRREKYV